MAERGIFHYGVEGQVLFHVSILMYREMLVG
jgi:hypothetical protein